MRSKQQIFWLTQTPETVKNKIKAGVVCAYLSALATSMGAIYYNPMLWLDALLMLSLALGTHLGKSRVCAVVLTAYFLFSKLTQFLGGGGFGGITAVVLTVAFVGAAIGTFQFQALWQAEQQKHNTSWL